MKFKELPQEKVEIIKEMMERYPNSISGSAWLSVYPCQPGEIFDNQNLLNKAIVAAIVASGSAIYSLDLVRKDGDIFDIDRYLLSGSGSAILRSNEISKDFSEHHSSEIPPYYLDTASGSIISSAPEE